MPELFCLKIWPQALGISWATFMAEFQCAKIAARFDSLVQVSNISGLDEVNMMYGRFGFVSHDRSVKAMLESGAEIDELSLSLLKRQWRVPMCLKSVVASLVGWYLNSPSLAEGFRIPLYAK